MDTDRNIQKIGLLNLVILLLVGAMLALLSRYAQSATGLTGSVLIGFGVMIAAVSYFQMRLEHRERLEKMEFDELKKSASASSLFTMDVETFPAQRARLQFERYFIPVFSVFLLLVNGAACYGLWFWLKKDLSSTPEQASVAMALASLFALVFFLLGKYSAGIARLENQRLLRPAASYLLLGALIGVALALTEAAGWFGLPNADLYTARVVCVLIGLVGIETLINVVFEIYRPRLKGQPVRLLYESRLVGLLSQPAGLITTAAQALDYQFGFKVSETWFYQLLEKALAWIILLQLAALMLSTTIVILQPQEQALIERFGKPVESRGILQPGLHFKWPWPIDRVLVYSVKEIHTLYVGFTPETELSSEKTVVWTRPHFKEEFDLLVASRDSSIVSTNNPGEQAVPVNLLAVNIPIQYRISDLKAWAYNYVDAGQILQNLANREVVRYLINVDIEDIMGNGRLRAADVLRKNIQEKAKPLGVEIVFLGLQGIHPPVKVAEAYEEVLGAMQEKETNILGAQAYWAEKIPSATAEATNLINKSLDEGVQKSLLSAAESAQFSNQLTAFQASPSVYKQRAYLETLANSTKNSRKYVLATTNTQDSLWLNLEDKIRPDLLNITVPDKK